MLGKFHGSTEHFYVPNLVSIRPLKTDPPTSHTLNLFRLDWDSVDAFKRQSAGQRHDMITLPECYDCTIRNLVFALNHDYLAEINHCTQLYYVERHRVRKFDTAIRDMCGQIGVQAILCAFKLLSDCTYDVVNDRWLREIVGLDRQLIASLLAYKFWREATGSGLVWGASGLDKLYSLSHSMRAFDPELAAKYARCTGIIKEWERTQEVNCGFDCEASSEPQTKATPPRNF